MKKIVVQPKDQDQFNMLQDMFNAININFKIQKEGEKTSAPVIENNPISKSNTKSPVLIEQIDHAISAVYTLEFRTELCYCFLLVPFLDSILTTHPFLAQQEANIGIAMHETVINAIEHGNQSDPAKSVHVMVDINPQQFTATVRDEGQGFDYLNVPDPTLEENIEKHTGRGLFIIQQISDQMSFNEKGNEITFSFDL